MPLPEGICPLVEATLYLATAPKSNSAGAYFKAYQKVEAEGKVDVPRHLQDANRDAKGLGHGKGYVSRTRPRAITSASNTCPPLCSARISTKRQKRAMRRRPKTG
jgi:replication-associated recombination protein RarA